jgi:hypothetical protein
MVPPADENRAPSTGETANPEELNDKPEIRTSRLIKGGLEINCPNSEISLAMTIGSDMNSSCGGSRGSIRRNYEGVGENLTVYSYFERLFRPALRGDGLPFQWVGGERAGFA